MQRSLACYPVVLGETHEPISSNPEVTFIIGHRGMARLPNLLLTLSSIAGQKGTGIECIVVEQSVTPESKDHLPAWVRYIHTPVSDAAVAYNRSWAFNVGVRQARGRVLVLHDNDMLVPAAYAAEILARVKDGYEVVNLKRLIFYLPKIYTKKIFSTWTILGDVTPETVVQNLEAGGSIATTKDAYFAIGGFDESFAGWGGEDNEFWERAKTRNVWPYGYLPIIHLWHAPQIEKLKNGESRQYGLFWDLSRIPVNERIEKLTSLSFGTIDGPQT